MRLIKYIIGLTKKGINKNMKLEYKKALKHIETRAKSGNYTANYHISAYYENKDDIYFYIMEKLKSKGFKVEIEKWGCNKSFKRLAISWDCE